MIANTVIIVVPGYGWALEQHFRNLDHSIFQNILTVCIRLWVCRCILFATGLRCCLGCSGLSLFNRDWNYFLPKTVWNWLTFWASGHYSFTKSCCCRVHQVLVSALLEVQTVHTWLAIHQFSLRKSLKVALRRRMVDWGKTDLLKDIIQPEYCS